MYLVSRARTVSKLFFLVSVCGLFLYLTLAFYSLHLHNTQINEIQDSSQSYTGLRYILLWTEDDELDTINEGEKGQRSFLDNDCPDLNCYITTNKSMLNGDYTNFDSIIFKFNPERRWLSLPKSRSKHQKYVFYSRVPANDYPICNKIMDNFFNWTWTYKFGSDIFSPFIEVRDKNGAVIAPSPDVDWTKYKDPTKVFGHLDVNKDKTKAVMWIVKDCKDQYRKTTISLIRLKKALNEHSLVFDIYGCDNTVCPKGGCLSAILRDYYFYLVFDPSMSEDYVTEKIMMTYDTDAVPIVIGGADYTKFLPDGSYISFHGMTEETLANIIADTIQNPSRYSEFFTWRNLYTIKMARPSKAVCKLCELLNNRKFDSFSSYEHFRKWWYPKPLPKRCQPNDENLRQDHHSFKKYLEIL